MEYYAAIRKLGMKFAQKWMDMESIVLSEMSEKERDKQNYWTHLCYK